MLFRRILLVLVLFIALSGVASAADYNFSCNSVISSSGNYTMTNDTTGCTADYILNITASNVLLDCNSYDIAGSGNYGIYVASVNYINITNCNVSAANRAIWFNDVDYSIINQTNISGNGEGLYLVAGTSNNRFDYLNITMSGSNNAIYLNDAHYNIISNSYEESSSHPNLLVSSTNNLFTYNTVYTTGFNSDAHRLQTNSDNNNFTFINMTIGGNYGEGFILLGGTNNRITDNEIDGIRAIGGLQNSGFNIQTNNNYVARNNISTLCTNECYGVYFDGASGNIFQNNFFNVSSHIFNDLSSTSLLNTIIYNNSFGSVNWTVGSLEITTNGTMGLGNNITISNGSISIDSTLSILTTYLANLTFYSPDVGALSNPYPYKDGTICPLDGCPVFDNSSAPTYRVEVTNVSTHTFGEGDVVAPIPTQNTPTNATTVNDSPVTLNFTLTDNTDAIINYTIYIDGTLNQTGTASNDTATLVNITADDATFTWFVTAQDDYGNAANSSTFTFTLVDLPPNTAPALNQTGVNDSDLDGNVELSWPADTNVDVVGYYIYRSTTQITDATGLTALGTTTSTFIEDNTTVHNTTYWYAITTYDSNGNENKTVVSTSFNATANDTIMPTLPSISATTNADGSVHVNWTNTSLDVDGNIDVGSITFQLYKTTNLSDLNTSNSSYLLLNQTSDISYTDTNITTGTNYTYVVTVTDDGSNYNTSVESVNQASIEPAACTTSYGAWSDYTTCEGGEQTRNRTRTCYGGGAQVDTQTRSCSSGSSSATVTASNPTDSRTWATVKPKEKITMIFSDKEQLITAIELALDEEKSNVKLTVKRLSKDRPATLKQISKKKVYDYLEVEKSNFDNNDIEGSVHIDFKVEKSWLESEGIDTFEVILARFTEQWDELPTEKIDEDGEYVYFRAESPGFSFFAITQKGAGDIIAIDEDIQESTDELVELGEDESMVEQEALEQAKEPTLNEPATPKKQSKLWTTIIVLSVIIALATILAHLRARKIDDEDE